MNEAIGKLTEIQNSGNFGGIDAKGGSVIEPVVAAVEGGKIKPHSLKELLK